MLDQPLEKVDFIIFDIETTGLSPLGGDKIIEIAAVRVKNGKIIDEFSSLVNPQRENSAYFINHINDSQLEGAPLAKDVLPGFINFVKDSCLAAYNVEFDLSFIRKEAGDCNIKFLKDPYTVDVMFMAKRLLLRSSNISLKNTARFLGINSSQKHRALDDCRLTKEVFTCFLHMLYDKGISNSSDFFSIFGHDKSFLRDLSRGKLDSINKAISNKQNIKISYLSSSRMEINEREITPHSIQKRYNTDFLSGFCHLRNEERKFNLNGILKLQIV